MADPSAETKKVAIITGASSGIGRETAIALSAAGWYLAITARRADELSETASMCNKPDNTVLTLAGDIIGEDFVKSLFSKTVEKFGRIDLLFNNAGTGAPAVPMEDLPLSAFQHVVNVNLVAPFLCTREAVRQFKTQMPQGGRIINNGSLSAHVPRPHSVAYTATKHAITGLTKATALDGRPFGIACTQIDVGNAYTPMAARLSTGALQADGRVVGEAMFEAKHVADAIVHIAGLPNEVAVREITIMATGMPYAGRG